MFKLFKAEVENQLGNKIKAMRYDLSSEDCGRFDGSGEQRLGPFAKYLTKCGVVTPQTFFLNDFFSWNLIFRCFKVHHEFIIIFRNFCFQLNGILGKYTQ